MSIGMILLMVSALLVLFGVGQRVLDRMHLSDRMALVVIAAVFIGGLLPDIRFGRVAIGVGGALIPVAVCIWVMARARSVGEVFRALLVSVLTGLAVYGLGRVLPAEPERLWVDPNILYGLSAGLIAYILGRSRRAAFIGGIFGVLLADTAVALMNWQRGIDQTLSLGTAGALDAVVISGLLAVVLAEALGELLERIQTGKVRDGDDGAIGDGRRKDRRHIDNHERHERKEPE